MSSTDFTLDSSLRAGLTDEGPFEFRPVVRSTPVNLEKTSNKTLQDWVYEYRTTVSSLENEISTYQKEHKDLKQQVIQLIDENQRLSHELQNSLQKMMTPSSETQQMKFQVDSLKEQLVATTDAKDSALQMWNMALSEIDRLERTVEIHKEYNKALQLVQAELDRTKKDFLKSVTECENLQKEMESEVQTNSSLTKKIAEQSHIIVKQTNENQELKNELLRLETEKANIISKFQNQEKELEMVVSDNERFAKTLKLLERENKRIAEGEEESLRRAQESIRLAEEAILEKEVAVFREQAALKEMEKLQNSLDKLGETAAITTAQAVDGVKARSRAVITNLNEEVKKLETVNRENLERLDRLQKEKQGLLSECESLKQEWQKCEGGVLFQTLSQKLRKAESDRDSLKIKLEALQVRLTEANGRNLENKEILASECQYVKDLLKECQAHLQAKVQENNDLHKEKEHWMAKVQFQQAQDAQLQSELRQQKLLLEQKLEEQNVGHRHQLQSEYHKRTVSLQEVSCLLKDQQEHTAKWKNECKQQAVQFEEEVKKLQKKATYLKSQKEHLQKDLTEMRAKVEKYEEKISFLSAENTSLCKRLQLSEHLYQAHLSS